MLLYEKLKEFDRQLQRLQSDNQLTSDYAKGQLREYLNELMERKETEIVKNLSRELESIKQGMQSSLNQYVKSLFAQNKHELIGQVVNNLSGSLQEVIKQRVTQNVTQNVKQALSQRVPSDIERFVDEYMQELIEKPEVAQHTNQLISEHLSQSLKSQARELIQEHIQRIDFSFLSKQPQSFYNIIVENMAEFLQKKCEESYLQEYFSQRAKTLYKEITEVKDLQETHFLAQLHYANSVALNELKTFNDVLRESQEAELEFQKLENAIVLAKKRKEAIKANKEVRQHKAYKVV